MRTVASYLGRSNVAMTLNVYAEVDPDAKRAAASKVVEAFGESVQRAFDLAALAEPAPDLESPGIQITFTVAQLEKMLEDARRREPTHPKSASPPQRGETCRGIPRAPWFLAADGFATSWIAYRANHRGGRCRAGR